LALLTGKEIVMAEDRFAEFKNRQREMWSSFAPTAALTTPVAGHLVKFAGVNAMLACPRDKRCVVAVLGCPPGTSCERIEMLASPPDWLRVSMVPDAGVEPATFGLQNRCSTN
jgi:hypothetical protein